MRIKKTLFYVVALVLVGFVVSKLQHIDSQLRAVAKSGKKFSPSNVLCEFDHNPAWEVEVSPDLVTFVNVITQQPFFYLSKGFQAYAFVSQDGDYVLKFFQQQRLRERPFRDHPFQYIFSKSFRDKAEFIRSHREEIFSSSKLVFEEAREECGFLFVHLNRSENLLRGIRIIDPQGQSFKIKPDQASFIIQRKAAYVLPTLNELMKKGDIEGAKTRLNQIFDLLVSLARKGIVDSDYALIRNNNIGFIKDRAIYIDTGHITKSTGLDVRKRMEYEFRKRLRPLFDWLTINYPELASYYELRRNEILATLRGENALQALENVAIAEPISAKMKEMVVE